ncbi:MAG: sigma-54 dependent transcriptional regulator [Bacteroidota bacterium]|nr:sigma-54 dependent transcriptional regulator [Bacteroidota bacterium]
MDILSIKQRLGIIGNSPLLERAIDIARQVASTDLTVLINGESGTGKEFFPKIIHQLSSRKHGEYIAVNCGAIPEGTIDSELFGHEKGSFTGANEARKGYFEVVHGGTIFLDEVAELPLLTQVRLLRVLETGEFIRVGSSKVQKTNARVVAATNIDIPEAIQRGKFREDLYYRLNTVPIKVPALRERKEDIILLFKRFSNDFAEKYRMPPMQLDEEAKKMLIDYHWPGNIRQLKNITEQISVIEKEKIISAAVLSKYLPVFNERINLPVLFSGQTGTAHQPDYTTERDIMYRFLLDMKKDLNELKKVVYDIIENDSDTKIFQKSDASYIKQLHKDFGHIPEKEPVHHNIEEGHIIEPAFDMNDNYEITEEYVQEEESLSIENKEKELIFKALEKHKGNRKTASAELGISERTLYRKIKLFNLDV